MLIYLMIKSMKNNKLFYFRKTDETPSQVQKVQSCPWKCCAM